MREAGAAPRMDNIRVSERSIDLSIALRKNRSWVAHTLSYGRLSPDKPSLIDFVFRYDRYQRNTLSKSRYYWALPSHRLTPSSAGISRWLQACLSDAGVTPLPQVSWSSHSLRMGAASEYPAIGVLSYRIRISRVGVSLPQWKNPTSTLAYSRARVPSFFGHLSEISPTPYGVSSTILSAFIDN